jgi:hypothetical protein
MLDLAIGPTAGGAEVCGPSGCCADIFGADNIITLAKVAPAYFNMAIGLPSVRFIGTIPQLVAMLLLQSRMIKVSRYSKLCPA